MFSIVLWKYFWKIDLEIIELFIDISRCLYVNVNM